MFKPINQNEYDMWTMYQSERKSWNSPNIKGMFGKFGDLEYWSETLKEMDDEWIEKEKVFVGMRGIVTRSDVNFVPSTDNNVYFSRRTVV
jgi:hypothetical protein